MDTEQIAEHEISSFRELADQAIALNDKHSRLIRADVEDDGAIAAALGGWAGALATLALYPAKTLADLKAKAEALQTCRQTHRDRPDTFAGDSGLAASLVDDVLTFRG